MNTLNDKTIKKLAILPCGETSNPEAITEHFKNKNVEITLITDLKNQHYFEENEFDLVVLLGYKDISGLLFPEKTKVINIHQSLLPAFANKNAIETAFRSGVKVSGVTIHYVGKTFYDGKIIAQYPVFIDSTTSLDEFEEEIQKVENKLSPFVIESILDDKIFNFGMLLKPGGCGGSCGSNKDNGEGGCKGCGK